MTYQKQTTFQWDRMVGHSTGRSAVWLAHLPWARTRPFQKLHSFGSAFSVFDNLGNLLFAQRQVPNRSTGWVLVQFWYSRRSTSSTIVDGTACDSNAINNSDS